MQRYLDVSVLLGRDVTYLPGGRVQIQVLLETRPVADAVGPTTPIDYRFVVDTSGSMGDLVGPGGGMTKIDAAKGGLSNVVKSLGRNDLAMLATFEGTPLLRFPSRNMTRTARASLLKSLSELGPGGGTFISDALKMAFDPGLRPGTLPRIVLLTDGQSNREQIDAVALILLADRAREAGIPLQIYGTGSDYNWGLLQQVAIRAGGSSFCKHIRDLKTLEDDLVAELAHTRSTALDRVRIVGQTERGVRIASVTAMSPEQRAIPKVVLQLGPEQEHRDYHTTNRLVDSCGSMDVHRGQQYLIVLEMDQPTPGKQLLMNITIKGRVLATGAPFVQAVPINARFTSRRSQETSVNPEVQRVMTLVAAARQAEAENFEAASRLFRRGGDRATATLMEELHTMSQTGHHDRRDLRRTATTLGRESVTRSYTIMPDDSPSGGRKS